jgi:hypothetical protein
MMGGWIDEVQIGYAGGKHSIRINFVSPSCGYEPTVYMKLHRMTSSQAEIPSPQPLAWLWQALRAAILAFAYQRLTEELSVLFFLSFHST